jgi:hypothetical protein
MNHSELSPEELASYRELAESCRKAADAATDPKGKEYWLAAEAHWLSYVDKAKDH